MVYSAFLEALTAIAIYKDPNPFTALGKKLSMFILRDLMPPLMLKVRGLRKISEVSTEETPLLAVPATAGRAN